MVRKNKLYSPAYFFKHNRHKIRYNGNFTWEIIYNWGDIFCHNVELDITKLNTCCMWYQLKGDYIIIDTKKNNDGQTIILPKNEHQYIHWTDFNNNTRIGWRGPIMLWKDVKNGMEVYYKGITL